MKKKIWKKTYRKSDEMSIAIQEMELYLKLEGAGEERFADLFWSDNPPAEPETATGVISINIMDAAGNDLYGGELDITDTRLSLKEHVDECLELLDDLLDVDNLSYEIISEEEYQNMLEDFIR